MKRSHPLNGWSGALLVAAVYFYFLIFAQFAFLTRLSEWGFAETGLRLTMAAMAAGGILLSLLTPRLPLFRSPVLRLRAGLVIAAGTAFMTLLPLGFVAALAVAFLIGAGLGVTTVTLVTFLDVWCCQRESLLKCGVGVGLGYFACNIPAVFNASASMQVLLAGLTMAGAAVLPLVKPLNGFEAIESPRIRATKLLMPVVIASFTALIWLDSAAFFIIQHTHALKADTWQGDGRLWANGVIHLLAAIASALLLRNGKLSVVLATAFAALALACMLLANPLSSLGASLFYPAGVSLYSVALVAFPSILAGAESAAARGRLAGWLYAIAGWIGSALGIGMGQNLGRVPLAFVVVAGLVILSPVLMRLVSENMREVVFLAAMLMISAIAFRALPRASKVQAKSAVDRGREVYISEGCISCHSQYVRPGTSDELMWGPASTPAEIHEEKPPLIGNRRQGPDLAEVGERRSAFWLRAHLTAPDVVSGKSIMPSYAFLFNDQRGDDLVAYLVSLRNEDTGMHDAALKLWLPAEDAVLEATAGAGRELYVQQCSTCHERNGAARIRWGSKMHNSPPELEQMRVTAALVGRDDLARIIKFGKRNTDMPGHEWLSDQEVASLVLWLSDNNQVNYAQ